MLPQVRALWNRTIDLLRPKLNLASDVPVRPNTDLPYGINTFLEQEVEPAKRERQLQLIKDAGFTWVRQQFVWEDIEIDAKGDYMDRRNSASQPISAWDKYDNIVSLVERNNLKLIARLGSPPKWAHKGYRDLGTLGPPADFEDYADFVAAVVSRYKGRIGHYQIWNEPNIYPEWGDQRVNPEDYTKLLCMSYVRAKAIDPSVTIVAAALAPTIAQDGRDLSDLVFLQRMYNAGAASCFDVLSAQGYGLFSGPDDRRLNPMTTNISRHMLLRDIMVANGDAHKPIWLAEVNWNALPTNTQGVVGAGNYGNVTLEQQARYLPRAFERARQEWSWVDVMSIWFFKPASDVDQKQAYYYFRLLDPDFAPLPAYDSMRQYIRETQQR